MWYLRIMVKMNDAQAEHNAEVADAIVDMTLNEDARQLLDGAYINCHHAKTDQAKLVMQQHRNGMLEMAAAMTGVAFDTLYEHFAERFQAYMETI